MSLPSQSSRNVSRSSQVHYRRSRTHPLRRVGAIVVVVAVLGVVWFTLIRPRANKLTEGETLAQGDPAAQPTQPGADNTAHNSPASNPSQPQPFVINNAPARQLPGAGERPDPNRDIDRAFGANATPTAPTHAMPATNTGAANTDILGSAANQAKPGASAPAEPRPASRPAAAATGIRLQLDTARRLIAENDRVGARKLLSQTLINADLSETERQILRDELTLLNTQLIFSPVADPRDPITETYRVQSGDSLSRIATRRELATHWKLISRVNGISDPAKIRLGQSLKLVRGPFHVIVDKSDHRLDVYHGPPSSPSAWVYIRSFDVGLGASDGTPIGEFVVSANKLENPGWVNPRDAREQYTPNDPKNPIGEFWIGLTGVGQYASLTSLGIHGTIDPQSIGGDESMGCVRLADGDIDIIFELLSEHISRVLIVP